MENLQLFRLKIWEKFRKKFVFNPSNFQLEGLNTLSKEIMETLTAEEAAQNLIKLMASAHQDGHQYRITADEGTVVLLSEETYQNLIVTLELLATPGLMKGLKMLDPNPSALA